MEHKPKTRQVLILCIGILILIMLACSEAEQAPVQTLAAQAGQTALAEGKKLAKTEAAHLVETGQVALATEAYTVFGTVLTKVAEQNLNPFGTVNANSSPQFRLPVSGATASTGSAWHTGPDLYAVDYSMDREGADVYPTLPGRVVYSGWDKDYGWVVAIRHKNDYWSKTYYSIYAHLQQGSLVADKTDVDGTKAIGEMGNTGAGAQGTIHLHFAVRTSDQDQEGLTAVYGHVDQAAFNFQPHIK